MCRPLFMYTLFNGYAESTLHVESRTTTPLDSAYTLSRFYMKRDLHMWKEASSYWKKKISCEKRPTHIQRGKWLYTSSHELRHLLTLHMQWVTYECEWVTNFNTYESRTQYVCRVTNSDFESPSNDTWMSHELYTHLKASSTCHTLNVYVVSPILVWSPL